MLDTDTKRRIDTARDILVRKVPDPKSQVEQIFTVGFGIGVEHPELVNGRESGIDHADATALGHHSRSSSAACLARGHPE